MDEIDGNCAAKPISAAMHFFSVDFLAGCKKFAELAHSTNDPQEIRVFCTSCIINAVCFLEAKLNETVAIARICFDEGTEECRSWDEIKRNERRLSIVQKWNKIVKLNCGVPWDSLRDPFQSFATIASLRNELIHFKGDFYGKDEAPSNNIQDIMDYLGVKSNSTWLEDDCSSWVTDLLSERKLIDWVVEKITMFDDQYFHLIDGKS